jgi:WhiB family redox-sensing transcriptional regulator
MSNALCAHYGEVVEFFIDRGQDDRPAKAICSRCSVRQECLQYALDNRILHGIWGGTSARERERLRATHPLAHG